MKKQSILFALSSIILLLTSCGGGGGDTGGGGSTTGSTDRVLASVAVFDGNTQTATVGTELAEPLVALLLNQAGSPIAGYVVNFRVVTGGGSVFAGAAISDNNGIVRERWTLGTVAGLQKVEVRAVDSSGAAVVFATFEATAVADAPDSVSVASGNNQSAIQLQPLGLPVKVIIKDSYGNPVVGVVVVFTANNGGTVAPGTATTNAAGEAAASWTLGLAIGGQTLDAIVTGLPSVRFTATATQAPPSAAVAITKFSGDLQTVVQHSILPQPLQVRVTDILGNGVPGTQVVFSAAVGSGYITPTTVTTNSAGNASWSGYFHTAGQQNVDAVAAGTLTITFNTNVTPLNHPFDGEYNCGNIQIFQNSEYYRSMRMAVVNGAFTGDQLGGYVGGTLSESDGMVTALLRLDSIARAHLSGQLVLDSLNRATGAGTYYSDPPYNGNGNWTCERL